MSKGRTEEMNFWLTIMILLVTLSPRTVTGDELGELKKCLVELESVRQSYVKLIPSPLLFLDRKLHRMHEGMYFMNENVELLSRNLRGPSRTKFDLHLMSNSNEGCLAFKKDYEIRAQSLWVLCLSIYFLILVLTPHILSFIFRGLWLRLRGVRGKGKVTRGLPNDKKTSFRSDTGSFRK